MTKLYCGECESGSEIKRNVDNWSFLSNTEEGATRQASEFARKRGDMRTARDRCELVVREELHLAPCDWEQYLELKH